MVSISLYAPKINEKNSSSQPAMHAPPLLAFRTLVPVSAMSRKVPALYNPCA